MSGPESIVSHEARPARAPLTIPALRRHKVRAGVEPLAMLTAYDAPTARLAAAAGVDLLLVGDSVGTAVLGYDSTVPVTLDDIVHHAKAVRRGAPHAHVVADLPFLTYQVSDEQAVTNAGRLVQEGGADAVKLEGGRAQADRIRAIVSAGIPVVGHIGLTPQSAGALGGMRVQGRDLDGALALIEDARAVEAAGAHMLVVEVVPAELGALITETVSIPTIGIGAGAACDGQVLVWTDLAGLTAKAPEEAIRPRFAAPTLDLNAVLEDAFAGFAAAVRSGAYPQPEQTYPMRAEILDAVRKALPASLAGDDGESDA
ncbi:MAG: 3-methyl-2-oxobutanoate hydroxymethyltransferase [Thermomicrobiales bacterium]